MGDQGDDDRKDQRPEQRNLGPARERMAP